LSTEGTAAQLRMMTGIVLLSSGAEWHGADSKNVWQSKNLLGLWQ